MTSKLDKAVSDYKEGRLYGSPSTMVVVNSVEGLQRKLKMMEKRNKSLEKMLENRNARLRRIRKVI
jgi:hypothetical protein